MDCRTAADYTRRKYQQAREGLQQAWRRVWLAFRDGYRNMRAGDRIQTGILLVTFGLLCLNIRQVSQSDEQMEQQLKAMRDAVAETKESNRLTRQQVENDQRGWLSFVTLEEPENFLWTYERTFTATFINVGKSPCRGVTIRAAARPRASIPYEVTAHDLSQPLASIPSTTVVAPTVSLKVYPKSAPIDDANVLAAAQKGDLALYVWGQVKYRDIFNGRRWTRFCKVYNPGETAGSRFRDCAGYNDFR